MGIEKTGWRLLAMLRRLGAVDFTETATLGRQQIYASRRKLPTATIPDNLTWRSGDYADDLFRRLGARTVTSFDYSDYEGATHTHDFNKPLPTEHRERYTFVYHGGTIEHILDPRQALENLGAMVTVGGTLVVATICNGRPSHGFYQLSPEFFYSLLAPENGFTETRVFLADTELDRWHLVTAPSVLVDRNAIPNRRFDIFAIARKTAPVGDMRVQQSDYEVVWRGDELAKRQKPPRRWRNICRSRQDRHFLEEAPIFTPKTATIDLLGGGQVI